MIGIKPDPNADPVLMMLPLRGTVSQAVGTAARKQRHVGRITHVDPVSLAIFSTAWIFCGPCAGEIRRNGGRMPEELVQEAQEAARAGLLLSAPAGGSA
jgi:hypothetical protein